MYDPPLRVKGPFNAAQSVTYQAFKTSGSGVATTRSNWPPG
jgi:hypothetical protein